MQVSDAGKSAGTGSRGADARSRGATADGNSVSVGVMERSNISCGDVQLLKSMEFYTLNG